MKISQPEDLEIYWNLKDLLIAKNIRRPADFQTMLKQYGLNLTYGAVYSLIHEQPVRIPTRTILAIVKMLECDVNELIVIRRKAGDKPAEVKKLEPSKPAEVTKLDERRKKITGPKMRYD